VTYNAAAWLVDRNVAAGHGGRLATVCGERRWTYADLQAEVWRAQNALAALGVRRTERVALVMDDEPWLVAWFLGALRSGVVPVPLSTMLRADDLVPVIDDAVAGVVVVSARHHALVADAPARAAVIVDGDVWGCDGSGGAASGGAVFGDRGEAPVAPTTADSPGFWLYSSGTTGVPKGVMHRHGSLEATASTFARQVLRIGPEDRCLSVAKLFFAYGLGNSLTFPLSVGGSAVLCPVAPTVAGITELIGREQPTIFCASPGFLASILDADVAPDAFAGVRVVTSAGEVLPADLHRRFTSRFGVPLLDGIGTTEVLHIFVSNRIGAERGGSSGTVVDGYEVELRNEADEVITAPDAPGFLHVRGPSLAVGYWSRHAATQAAFRGDWLKTGDVYTRDADGVFTFLGRTTDMIKAGGIWVSPAEVEAVLVEHEDVLECAVVGVRDERGLETVVAAVVARSGRAIDAGTLEAHCRARMAAFKRPRGYVPVDALPRTATGKVRRFALRDALTQEGTTWTIRSAG
jgi:benzoate-CoA ligase